MPYSASAGARSSMVSVCFLSCEEERQQQPRGQRPLPKAPAAPSPPTLLLLRELQEAVPFILQCCRASLATSEMNFWAASETSRMLRGGREGWLGSAGLAQGPRVPRHTHMRGSDASKPARFR
ncbi:hypothetical protein E2320_005729 [Naja naja]|nr:hypothetical protein E2320_005729 [Naja naja]